MTRLLVYRFSAFGDVAMTVPVLRAFLEQNPSVEIIFVSRPNFKDLFDGLPRFQFHAVILDQYKGLLGMTRLANELSKNYQPKYVADLHDVIRTKMLNIQFKINKIPVFKIDKGKEEKKQLCDIYNLDKNRLKHSTERYADVFRSMGYPLILAHVLPKKSLFTQGIGFAPFAQHKGKMMPLEKSFELAKKLCQKDDLFLFGGGKNEIELLKYWENQLPNTYCLAGKLTLKEELDKIKTLNVMISMDSANMHLASLVGTRVISIWSATHFYAGFLGFGQSLEDIVHVKDLSCRPCSTFGDKDCYRGDWACLEELEINAILKRL